MTPLQEAFYNPSKENAKKLLDYLNAVSGKPLAISIIRENIFKVKWRAKENKMRSRCELQAAAIYLTLFLKDESLLNLESNIKTLIAEVVPYIKCIDANEDISFIVASSNTLPSAVHFRLMNQLFYKNSIPKDMSSRYDLDLLVLYGLRLSLEKRILGFTGIDYIYLEGETKLGKQERPRGLSKLFKVVKDLRYFLLKRRFGFRQHLEDEIKPGKQGPPVGLAQLLKIVKGLKSVTYMEGVNWQNIELVNRFINNHMHRHIRPNPWTIHQAFEVLKPFISPAIIIENGNKRASDYASTYVEDEQALHKEIAEKVKTVMPNACIVWKETGKEILIKKS